MQRLTAVLLIVCCLVSTGCASRGYLGDRVRDAGDIVTFTVGTGLGATASVGPIHAGLFYGTDAVGLKCGEFHGLTVKTDPANSGWCGTLDTFIFPFPIRENSAWGETAYRSMTRDPALLRSGKNYDASGFLPFVYVPFASSLNGVDGCPYPFYSQIECAVGLGVMVRVGFNPGELLDFFLGWFGIDIYNDDLKPEDFKPIAREKKSTPNGAKTRADGKSDRR